MKNILAGLMLAVLMLSGTAAFAHESAEVDGINILFGGDPEPILTDERQGLVWRFNDAETGELITDIVELEGAIMYLGVEYGPFTVRGPRRTPGSYRTTHIFTEPGEGEVTLSFKREGSDEVHNVLFRFTVNPRSDIEIP